MHIYIYICEYTHIHTCIHTGRSALLRPCQNIGTPELTHLVHLVGKASGGSGKILSLSAGEILGEFRRGSGTRAEMVVQWELSSPGWTFF